MLKSNKKRLLYITFLRIPSEKANSVQIMNTCEALSDYYHIDLVHSKRYFEKKNIREIYEVKSKDLNIISVFIPKMRFLIHFQRLWFYISLLIFYIMAFLKLCKSEYDIIFTRDDKLALVFELLKKIGVVKTPVYYELHDFSPWMKRLKHIDGYICLTKGIKDRLKKRRSIVLHDAVDYKKYSNEEKKVVVDTSLFKVSYIGNASTYNLDKGLLNIARAILNLKDTCMIFVGGPKDVWYKVKRLVKKEERKSDRFHYIPFVPYNEVAGIMKGMDCLVYTPPMNDKLGIFASPMKIFEYISTGIPVILSDLPVHREIASECPGVLFCEPDEDGVMGAIKRVYEKQDLYREKAKKNLDIAKEFSWKNRAKKIKEFIG